MREKCVQVNYLNSFLHLTSIAKFHEIQDMMRPEKVCNDRHNNSVGILLYIFSKLPSEIIVFCLYQSMEAPS